MDLNAKQLAGKPKKIGHLNDKDVFGMTTKGGLSLVVSAKDGAFETLGAGPHPAVARHIAKKRNPDVTFTELNKADYIEERAYASMLPKYEAITDAVRDALVDLSKKK